MRILVLFCMILFVGAMPISPELLQRLRSEHGLDKVVSVLKDAQNRGFDSPNPDPVQVKPGERLTLYAIAILVDFSDNVAVTPVVHYDTILSSLGTYPWGSMREYFLENSYDSVDVITTVVGWYRMPETYGYYVYGNYGMGSYPHNCQKLTEDAVWAADPYVDFSQFDNNGDSYIDALFIVHAGPGAEETGDVNDIWSHAGHTNNVPYVDGVYAYRYSTEPEDGYIGVFCHEAGHSVFGLPDLYDYGYDSEGVGMWSLMAGGSWGNDGRTPVHMDAYCRILSGFAAPVVPTVNQDSVLFPCVELNPIIYKLWTDGNPATQYFLVENRQQRGFDVPLPFSGMCIWHVDETRPNNNNQWYPGHTDYGHYKVAIEQADGHWDLERNYNSGDPTDPYPGWGSLYRNFNESTTPDSKDYNFNITLVGVENISNRDSLMWADIRVTATGATEDNESGVGTAQLVYPNPVRAGSPVMFNFPLTEISMLALYDAAGRLVRNYTLHGAGSVTWDGKDLNGRMVEQGIYFAVIKGERENSVCNARLVIIK